MATSQQNTFRERARFAGYVPTVIARSKIDAISAEAQAIGIVNETAAIALAGVKRDRKKNDPFGPKNGTGRNVRRQRWALAYETSLAMFGLPAGSVWVPCYIGNCRKMGLSGICDAWTMDTEHPDQDIYGSAPGTLILSCRACNSGKGWQQLGGKSLEDVYAVGSELTWIVAREIVESGLWNARERRESSPGLRQETTYYGE